MLDRIACSYTWVADMLRSGVDYAKKHLLMIHARHFQTNTSYTHVYN